MKKKQHLFFGFAGMLILSLTACGGGGGGGITTAFRFEDKAPPVSLNNRSVAGPSRAIMQGADIDEESFKDLDDFYTGLGSKVTSITPSEFSLALVSIETVTDGQPASFLVGGDPSDFVKVNFAENVMVVPDYPAEAGATTTEVNIVFAGGYVTSSPEIPNIVEHALDTKAKVTFPISPTVANAIRDEAAEHPPMPEQGWDGLTAYYNINGIYSISDTSITVTPRSLFPPDFELLFTYTGNEYKYAVTAQSTSRSLVIPMNTIVIPEDASSVTFSASMDLTGIIEQYPGNKFYLANKFWERLAISANF